MKYVGSKNRISKDLLQIFLKHLKPAQTYIEPFVGGCNMIDKIPSSFKRIGNDSNYYLIQLFKSLQKGYSPPSQVSESI